MEDNKILKLIEDNEKNIINADIIGMEFWFSIGNIGYHYSSKDFTDISNFRKAKDLLNK